VSDWVEVTPPVGLSVSWVSISPDERGRPREALVVLDEDDQPRAYLNRCAHLPVPLDGGSRDFTTAEGTLRCGTHGALYHRRNGLCYHGPCKGGALPKLRLLRDGDRLFVPADPDL
jgi:nitrite reductase/ring-hydroxylating ferredoxin subunit